MAEYELPKWPELDTEVPQYEYDELTNPNNEWLPKTDWSRDGIIANDD